MHACACVSLDAVSFWFPGSCGHLTIRVSSMLGALPHLKSSVPCMRLLPLSLCEQRHYALCHVQPRLLGRSRPFCAQVCLCADHKLAQCSNSWQMLYSANCCTLCCVVLWVAGGHGPGHRH